MTQSTLETRRRAQQAGPRIPPLEKLQSGTVDDDTRRRLRALAARLCVDCQVMSSTGECIHGYRCVGEMILELLEADDPAAGSEMDPLPQRNFPGFLQPITSASSGKP